MTAAVYKRYGGPEVLQLVQVPIPEPGPGAIRIKIMATSVTAADWRLRKAKPFLARLFNGILRPKKVNILGYEVAGVVDQTGPGANTFQVGERVFAFCDHHFGGYAAYTCLPEHGYIARIPEHLSFEQAAVVPVGALSALGFLRKLHLQSGQKICIYGASGSVGTYAIQLARYLGAHVTAVCSPPNHELASSLGAAAVWDYHQDFTTPLKHQFHAVFDAVGFLDRKSAKTLLMPGGRTSSVNGQPVKQHQDLQWLSQLLDTGDVIPVIDRSYALEQIQEAHLYVEQFRKKGNVAVTIPHP